MTPPDLAENSDITAESGEAFPIDRLPGGTAVVAAVVSQKFMEGASVEEISRDWGIDPQDAECIPVHPFILEALRHELIRHAWPDVKEQA